MCQSPFLVKLINEIGQFACHFCDFWIVLNEKFIQIDAQYFLLLSELLYGVIWFCVRAPPKKERRLQ